MSWRKMSETCLVCKYLQNAD